MYIYILYNRKSELIDMCFFDILKLLVKLNFSFKNRTVIFILLLLFLVKLIEKENILNLRDFFCFSFLVYGYVLCK